MICKGPLIVLIMTFYYLNWDFYGVRGKINDLIKSYLKNSYQRILRGSKDS